MQPRVSPGLDRTVILLLSALLLSSCAWFQPLEPTPPGPLTTGKGFFVISAHSQPHQPPLRVWTYTPAGVTPTTPVLFVMHGMSRNAESYLNAWIDFAKQHKTIIVAPEFSYKHFFDYRTYQLGNVVNDKDEMLPKERWSFHVIEQIFDHLRAHNGLETARYDIFGHSGGSQFIHRMVLLMPESRIDRAICANAGWYTLPTHDIAYPYGLNHTLAKSDTLKQALSKKVIVFLGQEDNDAFDPDLRNTVEAIQQGNHRHERGQLFYRAAKARAQNLDTPFAWQVFTVKGVGHDFVSMSEAAATLLTGQMTR